MGILKTTPSTQRTIPEEHPDSISVRMGLENPTFGRHREYTVKSVQDLEGYARNDPAQAY
jgi:hypothetical protein